MIFIFRAVGICDHCAVGVRTIQNIPCHCSFLHRCTEKHWYHVEIVRYFNARMGTLDSLCTISIQDYDVSFSKSLSAPSHPLYVHSFFSSSPLVWNSIRQQLELIIHLRAITSSTLLDAPQHKIRGLPLVLMQHKPVSKVPHRFWLEAR
jgi:hypothetical protein